MRKWCAVAAIVALVWLPVSADVTIVQTTTVEGPQAAMMSQGQLPKITQRIKGTKARSDIEVMGQTITAITDLAEKQVIILQPGTKTAQVVTPASVAGGAAPITLPKMDVSFTPTGKSQAIDGMQCSEHTFSLKLDMSELSGQAQMPPEAAAAMKDVHMMMNGSIWVAKNAPGAQEYTAFTKAAMESNLLGAVTGMKAGQSGGLDKLMAAAASAPGVPCLTEVAMAFEGSGPMVQAMKQMGPMKMIQKTSSVSTEPISDDVFRVPEGYTIKK